MQQMGRTLRKYIYFLSLAIVSTINPSTDIPLSDNFTEYAHHEQRRCVFGKGQEYSPNQSISPLPHG